ncbi:hypothetical protein D918_03400 [Trichuris suis]|nr:hypothetical protein D918_03400 [Trichuris suis]
MKPLKLTVYINDLKLSYAKQLKLGQRTESILHFEMSSFRYSDPYARSPTALTKRTSLQCIQGAVLLCSEKANE